MHAFQGFGQISNVCIQKYSPSNFVLPGRITQRNISTGAQRDNKPKLHDFLLYINVIISYSFRAWCSFMGAAIFIRHFENSSCDWLNHTMWYLVSISTWLCAFGRTIPSGSTQIQRCPVAWNLSQYCFIFEHNTDTNMLCRLFDNRKYMDIYLLNNQEYCYLGKQKISLYFSASTCEQL